MKPRGRPLKVTSIESNFADYVKKVDILVLESNVAENWRIFLQIPHSGSNDNDLVSQLVTFH